MSGCPVFRPVAKRTAAASALFLWGLVAAPPAGARSPKAELVVQMGHTSMLTSLAFSPDGKFLATGSLDKTARLWDAATGGIIRVFVGHAGALDSLAFSPDGRLLATAGEDQTARVWNAASGEAVRILQGHEGRVASVSFSPDGRRLATGSADGTARIWDAATGAQTSVLRGHSQWVASVAFSPDGKYLATGSGDYSARLWNAATGAAVRTFRGHKLPVKSVAFSPDGRRLATGSDDYTAKLWDVATGAEVLSFKGGDDFAKDVVEVSGDVTVWGSHTHFVESVSFSPDGRFLATADSDGAARLWDAATGAQIRSIRGDADALRGVAFSPDGRFLATAGMDAAARLWDAATGRRTSVLSGHEEWVNSVAFSPDGRTMATGGAGDKTVRVWSADTGEVRRILRGHEDFVDAVVFSPDGRFLATGGVDKTARIWDAGTGRVARILRGHEDRVNAVAFSLDGRFVATGSGDGTARLWSADTGREVRTFTGHRGAVDAVSFSPDGEVVATASIDSTVRLWSAATGREIKTLRGDDAWIQALSFSPDGRHLLTAWRRGLRLWDARAESITRSFEGHEDLINSVAFSADGKRFISGSEDNTARLWSVASSEAIQVFRGHTGSISSAVLSPDGKRAITASQDGTLRLWDPASGRQLAALVSIGRDWVVVAPEGYFDGTPGGLRSIRWSVGLQSFPLEAFSEGYYAPGLWSRLMSGEGISPARLPSVSEGFAPPPSVKIVSPRSGPASGERAEVLVEAVDRGGGIDEIRLYHNGKAVGGDGRGMKAVSKEARRTQGFQVTLVDGSNVFKAVAMSRDRIESSPDEITVAFAGPQRQAVLHVVGVGINEYRNSALNLNYAQPDAKALSDFFAAAPAKLFSETRRHELYDASATKAAILAQLAGLKTAAPQDVVVIYLAGHGDTIENTWYFIPYDLVYPEREESVKALGLSSKEIQEAMKDIRAQKVLLLMDACKSGSALLAFASRGVEDRKALSQLARASGVHVIAASTKDQFATEVKDLGHGVFTYTLLQGLSGEADASPKDGTVTVRELLTYVENTLPEVSRKFKAQTQYPVVDSRGMDFPLTRRR